jgi:hypothetical protein
VTINGTRANNDTATGSGTANWSRSLTLNSGTNLVSAAAADTKGNQTNVSMRLIYLPSTPITLGVSSGWHANGFGLRLTGPTGFSYRVDASSSLSNWAAFGTVFVTNSPCLFLDGAATSAPVRFYRAVIP